MGRGGSEGECEGIGKDWAGAIGARRRPQARFTGYMACPGLFDTEASDVWQEGGTDTGARVDSTAKKGASAKTAESSSEPIAIIKAAGSVSKSATKKQSGGKSDGRLVKVDMCVTGEGSVACSITLRGK
jgi:hypothetical protein